MTHEGRLPDGFRRSVLGKIINMTRLVFLGLLFTCGLSSCSPDGTPVAEAEYSARWETRKRRYHSLPTEDLYPRCGPGGSSAILSARVSRALFAEHGRSKGRL